MKKEVIYIDDTNYELDMDLIKTPSSFRDLFVGVHFKNIKECNDEIRVASYCSINHPAFGATPIDRREFIERMKSRKRD